MEKRTYQDYYEAKQHGEDAFPYVTYLCTMPGYPSYVPLHWHDEMEIVYIKSGGGNVSVNLVDHKVSAGSVVIVLPGELHSIHTERDGRMEYENIIFHPHLLLNQQTDQSCRELLLPLLTGQLSIPSHFPAQANSELVRCLNVCDSQCDRKGNGYQLMVKSQLYRLCYLLVNICPTAEQGPRDTLLLERMKPAIKYVELHYRERITIEQAAKECSTSSSHFMRCFKQVFHQSFVAYLKDYRLTQAAELLRSTDKTVLCAAVDTGFENLSYFNRCFKEKYGVTPGQYRKNGALEYNRPT